MLESVILNKTGKKRKHTGKKRAVSGLLLAVLVIGIFGGLVYFGYLEFGVFEKQREGHVVTKQVQGVVQDYSDWGTTTGATVAFYEPGTMERKDSVATDAATGVFTTTVTFTSDDRYDIFVYEADHYHSFYPSMQIPRVSDPNDDYIAFDRPFFVTAQGDCTDSTLTSFTGQGVEISAEGSATNWDVAGLPHMQMFISITVDTDGIAIGSAPGVSTWDPMEQPQPQYDDVLLIVRFGSDPLVGDADEHTKIRCETPGWTRVTTYVYTYFIYRLPTIIYSTDRGLSGTLIVAVTWDFTHITDDVNSLILTTQDCTDFNVYCQSPGLDIDCMNYRETLEAVIGT